MRRHTPAPETLGMPSSIDADRRRLLAKVPLFAKLDARELDALLTCTRVQRLPAKRELFHKGDEGSQVFVILEGHARVVTSSADGSDVQFGIMDPGEVFGELALLGEGERTATVSAIEPCELLVIDRRDFLAFLKHQPDVANKLLEVLASRIRRISEFVEDRVFLNLPSRLAKKLLSLRDAYGEESRDGIRIELKLSQQELGNMVGTSRESINKQMRAWEEDGVLAMRRGIITIRDEEALESLAGLVIP